MSESDTPKSVAIVGAGVSGLALALSLTHSSSLDSKPSITIYESCHEPTSSSHIGAVDNNDRNENGGAVMLSPNALSILDHLNLYRPLRAKGYAFDTLEFRRDTLKGDTIDTYEFGSESKYGYPGLRVYRYELINILLEAVKAAGVEIMWAHKFLGVINEDSEQVEFEISNLSTNLNPASQDTQTPTTTLKIKSSLLVGADGIHSSVRKYLYPSTETQPKFTGQAGITASIPTPPALFTSLRNPLTLMSISSGKGAFVIAPQKPDGSELLIGKQRRILGNPTRQEWNAIHADKQSAIDFLSHDNEVFGDEIVELTRHIPKSGINIWPFYLVPKLDRWVSRTDDQGNGRHVVILGDAAHAIPPSAGQGISQALEDVWMFALLLAKVERYVFDGKNGYEMAMRRRALEFWQEWRQERIQGVLEVNRRVDQRRLPRDTSGEAVHEVKREDWDLGWLYGVDIERVVDDWFEKEMQEQK